MKKPCIVLLLTMGTILGSLPERRWARAQDKKPVGYVLALVASKKASANPVKVPTLIEADASGGKAKVNLVYTKDCSENVEFTWQFDRNMVFLKPDETFTITTTSAVSGKCPGSRNPFVLANGEGFGLTEEIVKSLAPVETKGLYNGMEHVKQPDLKQPQRVYARPEPGIISGAGSTAFKVLGRRGHTPRLFFTINLTANTGREGQNFNWQIAYFYQAVYELPKPGTEVPITLDTPPKGSSTTVTIPGSDGTPPKGGVPPKGTETGGDPCQDPARQACIDKWLDKLTAILNRNAPERAPWSISRYGQLVFNQVRSVAPPDGWETKYKNSKHCFVWQEYGTAHQNPLLRGELPPLHSECGGGGTTTGGTQPTGNPPDGGKSDGGKPVDGGVGGGTLPIPPGTPVSTKRTLLTEKRVASPKQTVTVPVRLLNPAGVANINFEVAYNPAVVAVRGVTRGSLLGGPALFEANPNEQGRVRVGFAEKTGWSADGIVANLAFEVLGKPGDRTPLTLKVTDIDDANDNPLPIDLVHGEIVVSGPGGRVPGDCDGDGLVTAADALCALKMSVGLRPVVMTMDVNADHQVTSADARKILQQVP